MKLSRLLSRLRMRFDSCAFEFQRTQRIDAPRGTLQCADLEPRILMSASPLVDAAAVVQAFEADADLAGADQSVALAMDGDASAATAAESNGEDTLTVELVLVDTAVPEYQQLVDDLIQSSGSGRSFEIFLLNAERDGVQQISDLLSNYRNVDALHIVSHGTEGNVRLGSTLLNTECLAGYAAEIGAWGESLTVDGDILIYGCNLAGDNQGQALVESLSVLTSADVAASDDLTGHVSLGADWHLEYSTGLVETQVAFSTTIQQEWVNLLPVETVRDDFDTISFTGNNGTHNWTGGWIEEGESDGAGAGKAFVGTQSGQQGLNVGKSTAAWREADLTGATMATLAFDYRRIDMESGDEPFVEVSTDGGGTWTLVAKLTDVAADSALIGVNYNISAHIDNDTRIRFNGLSLDQGNDNIFVDNVRIEHDGTGGGGSAVGSVSDSDVTDNEVAEDATVGTVVGVTALATDPDVADDVTYSLDNSAGGLFDIDATTGVVTVDGALDFETAASHDITVRATSDDTSFSTQVFTINVTDVAATFTATGNATVNTGSAYTLNLSVTEPGQNSVTGWIINWGDGEIETVAGNPSSVNHTYTNTGFTNNILVSMREATGTVFQNELLVASYGSGHRVFGYEATTGAFLREIATADGLNDPIDVVVGPDGNIYVSGESSDHVLRYNATTGTFIDEFVSAGSGGLNSPGGMAFGADGNLYVASFSTDQVLRYNGTTGTFIDAFVSAGSGGIDQPYGLTFGPDGHLYVNSFNNDHVLRYNGTTGAFIDTFVGAGSGGLDKPEQMVFGPDGHLYVASLNTDSVLRYDGTTGAFIDSFVTTALGGLDKPSGIAFGPDGMLYVSNNQDASVLRYNGTTGAYIDDYVSAGSGGLVKPTFINFVPELQVTVTSNSPPTITSLANQTIVESGSTSVLPFTVGDVESAAGTLTVTATSDDLVKIPNGNLVLNDLGGGSWNVTATGAATETGTVKITVTVDDGTDTTDETFDVVLIPRIITVTTAVDELDGDVTDIASLIATSGGTGISLREAITATNNTTVGATPDEIRFSVGGGGLQVLNITSALPFINDDVIIDGTTQAGYTNTPLIVLDGNNSSQDGLVLRDAADGSTIRGLAVRDFEFNAISIEANSNGHTIEGNWLGALDPTTGEYLAGEENGNSGIQVLGSGTTIGGTTTVQQNVISGNQFSGVQIDGVGATSNTVHGNIIGANSNTDTVIANTFEGIRLLNGASGNAIGGTGAGEGNVISGNTLGGIGIYNASSGNTIYGNFIGTDSSTTENLGTAAYGIKTFDAASNNIIGGIGLNEGNAITNLGASGVVLTGTGTGNSVRGNLIHGNGGIGIDLGEDAVTTNDAGDIDTGANNLQNTLELTSATVSGTDLTVVGSLDSAAGTLYQLDFYASATQDVTGYGEAERYLASASVTTDGGGTGAVSELLTGVSVSAGEFVTATVTDPFGNTSEFALNVVAALPNTAPTLTSSGGQTITPSTNEDTTSGAFVVSGIVGTTIIDPDSSSLEGVAITSVTGNGTWEYSLNGTVWSEVSPTINLVSATNALLLRETDFLRYVPDNENGETASIGYRAWDQTFGTEGTTVTPGAGGGTSAISTAADTASLTVTHVNDAPAGSVTITGTPTEDQTLTAGNTLTDADGLGTISYQWRRGGVDISGATSSTYTLVDADVGTNITVEASYTDARGTAESVVSSAVGPIANVNDLPTGTVSITGTSSEGSTLTAGNSLADADGLGTISYQWRRGGLDISGATGSTYTLLPADVGTLITVVASYTDARGTAESVSSSSVGPITNVNNAPTGLVMITGSTVEDQVLTASNTLADADGLGAISYQWQRGGINISGATASMYTLNDDDVGTLITVVASYTDGHSTLETISSSSVGPITNLNDAPTGLVMIVGTPTEDQVLTATNSLADADGLGTISYQWQRGGTDIVGATSSTYTLVDADVATTITVEASYTDGHGTNEAVGSAGVGPIANTNDAPTGSVAITGTPGEGSLLTAGNTLADADGLGTISYQWRRGGIDIAAATSSTYTPGPADVGTMITVVASYTDGQGTAESVSSVAVGPISNTNNAPTGSVVISGTPVEDQVLSVTNSLADADGLTAISYQWQRSGVDVSGATATTYTLSDDDVGLLITVVASYTDGGGTNEVVSSSAVGPVANINDAPAGLVNIAGTVTENQTLTASNTLTDDDGLGVISYQWQRNGVDVSGASGTTYTLTAADVGATIRVVAAYTDGGGTSESVASAAVGPVAVANHVPTISDPGDQAVSEDHSTGPLPFVVNDVETPAGTLTVSASSSDTGMLPDGNVVLTNLGGGNWTVEAIPAANENGGPVTVTLTVSDGTDTASQTFGVTVAAVNDAPTLAPVGVQSVSEDESLGTAVVTVAATDVDDGDTFSYTIVAGNTDGAFLIDSHGTIRIAGLLDHSLLSVYTLTVQVNDSGGPALSDSMTLTVNVTEGIAVPATTPTPTETVEAPAEEATEEESKEETTETAETPVVAPAPPVAPDAPPAVNTAAQTESDGSTDESQEVVGIVNLVAEEEVAAVVAESEIKTDLDDVVDSATRSSRSNSTSRDRAISNADVFASVAYERVALNRDMQQMREQIEAPSTFQFYTAASAVTATSSLSVGYVLWAIRGGWLMSSLLAQMPAWRLVDPLSVLSSLDESGGDGEDDSLQAMLEKGVDAKERPPETKTVS